MKLFKIICIAFFACVTIGCASLPSPEEMKADIQDFTLPAYPEKNEAMVYIVRPSSVGTLIPFTVYVDERTTTTKKGSTRGNQYIYFPITPGPHTILSKAENTSTAELDVKAGEIYFLEQEAKMGIVVARNKILEIEDYVGTYHVKRLSLGKLVAVQ